MWLSEALEEQIRVLEPSLGRKIKPISKCKIFPQWRALGPLIPSKPTKLLHSPFVPQPAAAWWELAAIPLWCLPWHPWKTCTAPEDPSREESPSLPGICQGGKAVSRILPRENHRWAPNILHALGTPWSWDGHSSQVILRGRWLLRLSS